MPKVVASEIGRRAGIEWKNQPKKVKSKNERETLKCLGVKAYTDEESSKSPSKSVHEMRMEESRTAY